MADPVLLFHRKLCHGFSKFRQIEKRIIAEAAFPLIEITDDPITRPFSRKGSAIRPDKCDNAGIVALAVIPRVRGEVSDELLVIGFIVAMVSGIARRVYPRPVSKRAGNDARVIGEHGNIHRLRIAAGLLQRIFFEGRPRLFRVFYLRNVCGLGFKVQG